MIRFFLGAGLVGDDRQRLPWRDHPDPIRRHSVCVDENVAGGLGQRDQTGTLGQMFDDPPLVRRRIGDNGVEGDNRRHLQMIEEIDHRLAGVATEYPELMLD